MDIHNYKRRLERTLEKVKNSSISNRFCRLLPDYNKTYKVMPPQISDK